MRLFVDMNLSPKWVDVLKQKGLGAIKNERCCPELCAFIPFLVARYPSQHHSFNFLIKPIKIGIYLLNLGCYNKTNCDLPVSFRVNLKIVRFWHEN